MYTGKKGRKPDTETLKKLYLGENMTAAEIAAKYGVSTGTAAHWLCIEHIRKSDYAVKPKAEKTPEEPKKTEEKPVSEYGIDPSQSPFI